MLTSGRASLPVAISLLISTATAHAECAWVFWEQDTISPTYEAAPRAVSAWNTKDMCEEALSGII
jgi:hypothetical protein